MQRNQIFLKEIRDSHGDEREMQYQYQFWTECYQAFQMAEISITKPNSST
jgi:hypothetical protein